MSAYTKRKYVAQEVENFFELPEGKQIAKIIRGQGNNLHLVETETGEQFLASMPTKFRKYVWVKRGDFVVIEPIEEGVKVKAEIIQVIIKNQIKYFKKEGLWPKKFCDEDPTEEDSNSSEAIENKNKAENDEDYSSDESELEENPNHRPRFLYSEGENDDDDEDSNEEETDEEDSAGDDNSPAQSDDEQENDVENNTTSSTDGKASQK